MSGKHSILAPSKGETWIMCPGSTAMGMGIIDQTSEYAEEGTAAHTVASTALLSEDKKAKCDDTEMAEYVQVYVDRILAAAEGKMLLVEQFVSLERYTSEPGGGGTSDAIIVDLDHNAIEVHDLKYGKGVIVNAEENYQMMLYALGAIDLVEELLGVTIAKIKCVIHQVRRDHLSEWETTRVRLNEFGLFSLTRGKLALSLMTPEIGQTPPEERIVPELHASEDACRWCPAARFCPEMRKTVQEEVFADFEVTAMGREPEVLNEVTPANIPSPKLIALAKRWVKNAEAFIEEQLNAAKPAPGWKLVLGKRGNRKWTDEEKAEELCKQLRLKKSETHKQTLLTPTQLEKVVADKKWPLFAELITQADGVPTVVSEDDPKPAYVPASADDFADLSGDDNFGF